MRVLHRCEEDNIVGTAGSNKRAAACTSPSVWGACMSKVSAATTEAEPAADCIQQSSQSTARFLQCLLTVLDVKPLALPALAQKSAGAMFLLLTMDGSLC